MNQNAIETRANLLEAFLRIYEVKPLSQITVKEICSVAGYNRSTFYNHFNDVPTMLTQVEDEVLVKIEGIVGKLTATEIFQTDAIFIALKGIYQANERALSILLTKPDCHFPQKLKNLMEKVISGFARDLTQGDREKLKLAISYHFSAVIGVMGHWLNKKDMMDMSQVIDYVKEISREGVLTIINKMI